MPQRVRRDGAGALVVSAYLPTDASGAALIWHPGMTRTPRGVSKHRRYVTLLLQEMLPRGRGQAQLLMQYQHSAMARTAAGGRFFEAAGLQCWVRCFVLIFCSQVGE